MGAWRRIIWLIFAEYTQLRSCFVLECGMVMLTHKLRMKVRTNAQREALERALETSRFAVQRRT